MSHKVLKIALTLLLVFQMSNSMWLMPSNAHHGKAIPCASGQQNSTSHCACCVIEQVDRSNIYAFGMTPHPDIILSKKIFRAEPTVLSNQPQIKKSPPFFENQTKLQSVVQKK